MNRIGLLFLWLALAAPASADQVGVNLIGRWMLPDTTPTATYAGSQILLNFEHSTRVAADFSVSKVKGDEGIFISVSIDGGKALRMELTRGPHAGVILASGLSRGPHRVAVRKEGEPHFGALQFSNPKLDVSGKWLSIVDDSPIVEVIGDSDATGICVLGPDSPVDAAYIYTSSWASQSLSWVGQLESGLAARGYPVDMVDLAISGSTAASEATAYDLTAPRYSDAHFAGYSPPGHPHAALVLLWGGGNDRHGGGDLADGSPNYDNLSRFQRGVYDQLSKIFARNPDVRIILLEYLDSTIPNWTPAYEQVRALLPTEEQARIFIVPIHDAKGASDACEVDPKGHPNLFLHTSWAAQILAWMTNPDTLRNLGWPVEPHWTDE